MRKTILTVICLVLVSTQPVCKGGGPAVRLGDQTSHGGIISFPGPTATNVFLNNQPVVVAGAFQLCPLVTGLEPHGGGPVLSEGNPKIRVNGIPIMTNGAIATCVGASCTLIGGSTNVFIGP